MPDVISTTVSTPEGEMLWCVHYKSSFYDDDERMPGTVPVDERAFVLAKSRDEAIAKAAPSIAEGRKQAGKGAEEKIDATIVTLENLVPARDSSADGRLGFFSTESLRAVELSSPEDAKRYRLCVCLVPLG